MNSNSVNTVGELMTQLWKISNLKDIHQSQNNPKPKKIVEWFFQWPPDVFLLTSLIFKSTGTYIHAVSPPYENDKYPVVANPSVENAWHKEVKGKARYWKSVIIGTEEKLREDRYYTDQKGERQKRNSIYKKDKKILENGWSISIDDLYNCKEGSNNVEERKVWTLARLILDLHSISDEACRGIGILSTDGNIRKNYGHPLKVMHLQANYLLVVRGTLSRIPKNYGIILPKSRTSQYGTTTRSFSFNLSYHSTEVDVLWRTFPWNNSDESIFNVMLVPWPYNLNGKCFYPISNPKNKQQFSDERYFEFDLANPQTEIEFNKIIGQIKNIQSKEIRRIHLIVFPEASLTFKELMALQSECLKLEYTQIPMVIAGIRGKEHSDSVNEHQEKSKPWRAFDDSSDASFNYVVLSTYFAGRWYNIIQSKHHRWFLNSNQIYQYGLSGALAADKIWWEYISIRRRTISFLSIIPWLTLTPLICEDIARLDPVSEIIRGVGPNLLVSILLDGPQLKSRWSGRYASVFADDPGSSVLTLTSLGMSKRSKQRKDQGNRKLEDEESAYNTIVSLWKDPVHGFSEIKASNGFQNSILSLNAVWQDECTADGRKDERNSSVLALQEVYPLADIANSQQDQEPISNPDVTKDFARFKWQCSLDCYELTLFTYYIDSIVDLCLFDGDRIQDFKDDRLPLLENCLSIALIFHDLAPNELSNFSFKESVYLLIRKSIEKRNKVPNGLPSPSYIYSIYRTHSIFIQMQKEVVSSYSSDKIRDIIKLLANNAENLNNEKTNIQLIETIADCAKKTSSLFTNMEKTIWPNLDLVDLKFYSDDFDFIHNFNSVSKDIIHIKSHFLRLEYGIIMALYSALHNKLEIKRRKSKLIADEVTLLLEIENKLMKLGQLSTQNNI